MLNKFEPSDAIKAESFPDQKYCPKEGARIEKTKRPCISGADIWKSGHSEKCHHQEKARHVKGASENVSCSLASRAIVRMLWNIVMLDFPQLQPPQLKLKRKVVLPHVQQVA
jgi:hypothetical protein